MSPFCQKKRNEGANGFAARKTSIAFHMEHWPLIYVSATGEKLLSYRRSMKLFAEFGAKGEWRHMAKDWRFGKLILPW
jgi:hypothetical protein